MAVSRSYASILADEVVEIYFNTNKSLWKILREVREKYECKKVMQNFDT